jgi:ATP-dependent DNA helicase RecG
MSQATYQRLLLERTHAKQRWENLPTAVSLEDLDLDEILRTLRLGAAAGRMPASVSEDPADVLDRLGLRVRDRCSTPLLSCSGVGCYRIILSAN